MQLRIAKYWSVPHRDQPEWDIYPPGWTAFGMSMGGLIAARCSFDAGLELPSGLPGDTREPLLRADVIPAGNMLGGVVRILREADPNDRRVCVALDLSFDHGSEDWTEAQQSRVPCRNRGKEIEPLICPLCQTPGAMVTEDKSTVPNIHPLSGEESVFKGLPLALAHPDAPVRILATHFQLERAEVGGVKGSEYRQGRTLAQFIVMEPQSNFRVVFHSEHGVHEATFYCYWDGSELKFVRNDEDKPLSEIS